MVVPARNRVAAAAARTAPDLDVIFMRISSELMVHCPKGPRTRSRAAPRIATGRNSLWLHTGCEIFVVCRRLFRVDFSTRAGNPASRATANASSLQLHGQKKGPGACAGPDLIVAAISP